jgi:hypothetical protein
MIRSNEPTDGDVFACELPDDVQVLLKKIESVLSKSVAGAARGIVRDAMLRTEGQRLVLSLHDSGGLTLDVYEQPLEETLLSSLEGRNIELDFDKARDEEILAEVETEIAILRRCADKLEAALASGRAGHRERWRDHEGA